MNEFEIIILVLLIFLLLTILILIIFIRQKLKNNHSNGTLTSSEDSKFTVVDTKLSSLEESNRYIDGKIAAISETLSLINNTTQNIPNISLKVSNISDIFLNVKNRGNFGEFQLETILQNVYGVNNNQLKFQHSFLIDNKKNIVDATIKIDDNKYIAIDSKFPLDNYKKWTESKTKEEAQIVLNSFKQDIKNKIKEAKKYISPQSGIDFVILFIPSEKIYSSIVEDCSDIVFNASANKIYFTSPTLLIALMNIIVSNAREFAISKEVETSIVKIKELEKEFNNWNNSWAELINSVKSLNKKVTLMNTRENKVYSKLKTIFPSDTERYNENIDENRKLTSNLELTVDDLEEESD